MRGALVTTVAAILLALAGCESEDGAGGDGNGGGSAASESQRSKHEQEIYDQQKGVCRTEQQHNTVEYREQSGATDPERYAEYAAEHGFYLARNPGEREAAIEGCLAGLK